MTIPVNLARLSGLRLPCGFDFQGLPIGLQIIANVLREDLAFQAAYAYKQATEWHQQSSKINGKQKNIWKFG
jgi:aspartyl-tRNA(Asn)/glutamyl-tRNA(Gln) amidotransferase subunit A